MGLGLDNCGRETKKTWNEASVRIHGVGRPARQNTNTVFPASSLLAARTRPARQNTNTIFPASSLLARSGEVRDGEVGFAGPNFRTPASFSLCLVITAEWGSPNMKKTEPDSEILVRQTQLHRLALPCSVFFVFGEPRLVVFAEHEENGAGFRNFGPANPTSPSRASLLCLLCVRRAPFVSVRRTRRKCSRILKFWSCEPNFTVSHFPASFSSCETKAGKFKTVKSSVFAKHEEKKLEFARPKFRTPASCLASPICQCLPNTKEMNLESENLDRRTQQQRKYVSPCSTTALRGKLLVTVTVSSSRNRLIKRRSLT